jgi:hypothetical protein
MNGHLEHVESDLDLNDAMDPPADLRDVLGPLGAVSAQVA